MKQVLIKGGAATVVDVAAPMVGARNVLVRVRASCISAGTEMAGLRMSGGAAVEFQTVVNSIGESQRDAERLLVPSAVHTPYCPQK